LKKIIKNKEPKSLTVYRSGISHKNLKDANIYEDFKEKTKEQCKENTRDNLRKQLLEEQGYICAYCMGRIDCTHSKIEHFKPQTKYRDFQIDYQNLFITCLGGEGSKGKNQFCDTFKGESELTDIDLLSQIEKKIDYSKHRESIIIKSSDTKIDRDINDVLNLNLDILQKNRKQVYDRVLKNLKAQGFTVSNIQKTLNYYQDKHNGKFEPYCEMIVYFLLKKLKAKGIK